MLYHPLTPFFVLFCNVVSTSNLTDFHTLKRVTSELESLVELSNSIAKLQTLFNSFLELCEGLVSEKRQKTAATDADRDVQVPNLPQVLHPLAQQLDHAPDSTESSSTSTPHDLLQSTYAPLIAPEADFLLTLSGTPSTLDSEWRLFDVQPTLDWLDADFSFFSNE